MSESRFTNPSTPGKPSRARKRAVKAKATETQPEAPPRPSSEAASGPAVPIRLSAMDRESMIQTAAYYRAQRRNFQSGRELEDWLAAESEIDAVLLLEGGASS
ncbi:MAG TPA: DUF2934 domain-containing protein [Steroidobacteraceae bacterium]|nr:DUF2934 domain-containing protein [Steroidobacteraceae bacterium]